MAKLVEILARELKEWSEDTVVIAQDKFGITMPWDGARIYFSDGFWYSSDGSSSIIRDAFNPMMELSDDYQDYVTRTQWEAERACIERHSALVEASMMELEEAERARQLAESSKFTESDKAHIQELAAIACGKQSKEDQALWDKVALTSTLEYMGSEPNLIGSIPVEEFVGWGVDVADAFMAERAKRMENNQ